MLDLALCKITELLKNNYVLYLKIYVINFLVNHLQESKLYIKGFGNAGFGR